MYTKTDADAEDYTVVEKNMRLQGGVKLVDHTSLVDSAAIPEVALPCMSARKLAAVNGSTAVVVSAAARWV